MNHPIHLGVLKIDVGLLSDPPDKHTKFHQNQSSRFGGNKHRDRRFLYIIYDDTCITLYLTRIVLGDTNFRRKFSVCYLICGTFMWYTGFGVVRRSMTQIFGIKLYPILYFYLIDIDRYIRYNANRKLKFCFFFIYMGG